MPEPYTEGGVQDSEFGLSIEAISALDISELAYFDACTDYAKLPSQDNLAKIKIYSFEQAQAFSKALGAIADENTVESYAVECESLFQQKETQRVDFLIDLTGSDKFWTTNVDMPENEEASDEVAAMQYILDHWTMRNSNSLQHDTNQFVDLVKNSPAAERFNRQQALKQHALDIAKIALGTGAAIIFTSRFRRRQ